MLDGGRDTLPEAVVALAFAGAQLRFVSATAPLFVCMCAGWRVGLVEGERPPGAGFVCLSKREEGP